MFMSTSTPSTRMRERNGRYIFPWISAKLLLNFNSFLRAKLFFLFYRVVLKDLY